MTRPARSPRPLTIAEATEYLGYRTTAGVRGSSRSSSSGPAAAAPEISTCSSCPSWTATRVIAASRTARGEWNTSEARAFSSVP